MRLSYILNEQDHDHSVISKEHPADTDPASSLEDSGPHAQEVSENQPPRRRKLSFRKRLMRHFGG